ncbi:MAG TPA: acetate--CoA ligase family protein [Syntrophales bacterium]|mgnify:CR=1 FL=1|nr:acetate--CoA ligase family protein [Syntrophales bacterium]HOM06838.1 acetate--CoA ligase family protein [Syntrophales bacterium]HON99356.1 acetate--CoA ligase family protein [Syntrophales bacterium]HPC00608.1 acetate--CoA ligase family protein [Syntrophales bacterium]HPQ06379.1 acetate--CoA ligase family protein [Syntrophales bacterium]
MRDDVVSRALAQGRSILDEHEAKGLLSIFGIPVTRERLVTKKKDLAAAVREVGLPCALKACSPAIAHKTELDLVRLNIASLAAAARAYAEIRQAMGDAPGGVLVQEMVSGRRELAAGMTRDEQFGPCVMFGLGGIFTEILKDVSFRKAPLTRQDALAMMDEIRGHRILEGVRGMEPVDRERLAAILMTVGAIATRDARIKEIDINPLIVRRGTPVAADALIVLDDGGRATKRP